MAFLEDVPSLEPGCVLLDMRMPELNGLEVIAALGNRLPRLPVVMMTGHGDIALAVRALKLGASDFLEKPCADDLLHEALERAFAALGANLQRREKELGAQALIGQLTPREAAILTALAKGLPNKVVAFQLNLSVRTVEMYRGQMMDRLGVRSLPEAVRLAFVAGMLDVHDLSNGPEVTTKL